MCTDRRRILRCIVTRGATLSGEEGRIAGRRCNAAPVTYTVNAVAPLLGSSLRDGLGLGFAPSYGADDSCSTKDMTGATRHSPSLWRLFDTLLPQHRSRYE